MFLTLLTHEHHLPEYYLTVNKDSIGDFSSNNMYTSNDV